MDDKYLKAIKEGIAEYRNLSEQRKALNVQMQKVLQLIAANVNMLPDAEQETYIAQLLEMTPPSGMREAVIRVLKTDERLSPTEVRDKLVASGYDFSGQANPLASIHTTLKRLVESGDAIPHVPQPDGKTYYTKTEDAGTISMHALLGAISGLSAINYVLPDMARPRVYSAVVPGAISGLTGGKADLSGSSHPLIPKKKK